MTAVAAPPNFQAISRSGWSTANGAPNGLNSMSADEVSRMFMPRKSAQRTNSSSSIASSSSSSSTVSASSVQSNGVPSSGSADSAGWGSRKKPTRSLWPPSKAEPMAGLSNARPQPVASSSSGASAATAMSALHTPSSMLPSQNGVQSHSQQNGVSRTQGQPEPSAVLHLLPMNGTFERKTITVPFFPEVLRIGRQTNTKTVPTPLNGYFDSKVLSRQHAEIWADRSGRIYIRDVKSSNGTFVNGDRLSGENKESDAHELKAQDILELGIDIVSEDQKTVVHHKVAARVEHAGFYGNAGGALDLHFGELDPSVNGALTGQPMQNMGQFRGRTGSQGSMGSNGRLGSTGASVAGSNMTAMGQRNLPLWLSPISIDQVVKKLNTESKMASQQIEELQRTNKFLESVLANEPKKEASKPPHMKPSPTKADIKARFSEPPAPPPQQPLPEKPDIARSFAESILQPALRRTDTEMPRSVSTNSSPVRADSSHQISSLVEALTTAKKELDSQSIRLRDLEDMLAQERQARESAEERAQRLEKERQASGIGENNERLVNGVDARESDETGDGAVDEKSSRDTTNDAMAARLQQLVDRMTAENNEMKQQMEKYRRRAEEAEEDAKRSRQSLAEMIEEYRRKDAEREAKEARQRRPSSSSDRDRPLGLDGAEANGEIKHSNGSAEENALTLLKKAGVEVGGRPVTPEQAQELQKGLEQALAKTSSRGDHIAQAAPFASIVGVILLGYGLMTYLNGLPKLER